jgi:hypothetical protein
VPQEADTRTAEGGRGGGRSGGSGQVDGVDLPCFTDACRPKDTTMRRRGRSASTVWEMASSPKIATRAVHCPCPAKHWKRGAITRTRVDGRRAENVTPPRWRAVPARRQTQRKTIAVRLVCVEGGEGGACQPCRSSGHT